MKSVLDRMRVAIIGHSLVHHLGWWAKPCDKGDYITLRADELVITSQQPSPQLSGSPLEGDELRERTLKEKPPVSKA